MCVITDLEFPEGTEVDDAEMLSWWFAWHTMEDIRYMMWNPTCHYGVWVTTGNYDTRTEEEIEAEPMRIFDTGLSTWYERAYGSVNRAHENTKLTSTSGTDAYLLYDGTNSKEFSQLQINFVDLTDPTLANMAGISTPYFSSSEEFGDTGHSIAEEYLIQAGVTGESSVLSGVGVPMAAMLHMMRQVDGEWKLITHFSSGGTSGYVSEHQVREFAMLAAFLPELYAMEKDKDLKTYADPNCYLDPEITTEEFYSAVNETLQYELVTGGDASGITRAEAAVIVYKMLQISDDETRIAVRNAAYNAADPFSDVDASHPQYKEIAALWYYGALDVAEGSYRPDSNLTQAEAALLLNNAMTSQITVTVGSSVLVRDKMELTMSTETAVSGDDILVDKGIIGLLGGAEVPAESQTVEPSEGQIVVHFAQIQKAISVNADDKISLNELASAYGGTVTTVKQKGQIVSATLNISRTLLKSNRELNERELALVYAKFYLRYWQTPLPERPDEIVWADKKDVYYAVEVKKEDDTILNPNTYYKLLDPEFVPEQGWSTSSDGKFTTMCVITDLEFPEGTEVDDAEMLSWWFAWHTLEDLRYMMWNPTCHYGVWVSTGEYDTRTEEQIAAEPMRLFDTTLSTWYERAYGSVNRAHENTKLTSTSGTAAYLAYDGTNSKEFSQLLINFVDLTDPTLANRSGVATPYFSSSEEFGDTGHSIAEEYLIQAGVTGEPSVLSGVGVPMAAMLHVMRQVDGEWKLITHFSSGGTSGYVSEHQVREFAILASFLPELYAMEKDKDLETYADPNCY